MSGKDSLNEVKAKRRKVKGLSRYYKSDMVKKQKREPFAFNLKRKGQKQKENLLPLTFRL